MGSLTDPLFLAIKAALASGIAVLLALAFGVHDTLSAGFVAIACMSPTAYAGLKRGGHQVAGSLLGGGIATILKLALPAPSLTPLVVLVSVFLSVLACARFGMSAAYAIATLSAVYVAALPFASATIAIETRLLAVAIGIGVATATNLGISTAFSDTIVERRMRLARERVADTLVHRGDADADARFEAAFAVASELRTDLEAAHRELFSGRTRRVAERHLSESINLRRLLHVAKTLVLLGRSTAANDAIAKATERLRAGALDDATVDAVFLHLGQPDSAPRRF